MPDQSTALTVDALRTAVADIYGQVAVHPAGDFPFPVGRAFAESLGYPPAVLDGVPPRAVDAFAGISHPLAHAVVRPGEQVLDLGCGAGLDTILAARQISPGGHIHALDVSAAMIQCARENAAAAGAENVTFYRCPAEAIPLPDGAVDVAHVNGIFNLCPDKEQVMAEVYRVLRPGGRLVASEIVIQDQDEAEAGEACSLADMSLSRWFQ